jgi:hypothetical protein
MSVRVRCALLVREVLTSLPWPVPPEITVTQGSGGSSEGKAWQDRPKPMPGETPSETKLEGGVAGTAGGGT